MNNSPFSMPN